MFKNRFYVYGLGSGLVVGALLLQIMNAAQGPMKEPQTGSIPVEELDAAKLKEQASKFYQVFDKNVTVYTQADFDAQLQQKLQEEKDKLAAAQPSPAPAAVQSRTVIYVQPHLTATAVAELLFKSGIIPDQKQLEDELVKQKLTDNIQVGYHVFEGTLDMQQVIQNLLAKQ